MGATTRHCLALDLKDDPELIAAYEEHHKAENAWPEVVASIASAGIAEMEIFRTGNRLFMIIDVTEDFDWDKMGEDAANDPKVREWEVLMEKFQQFLPWAKPDEKWVPMDRIYKLTEAQEDIAQRG